MKGLRLRKVFLREGNLWKEVLGQLKDSMANLEWISLTGIGYAHPPMSGAEMPEEFPPVEDSSEESDNDDSGYYSRNYVNGDYDAVAGSSDDRNGHIGSEDDEFYGDADSEEEPRVDIREIEFMDTNPSEIPQAYVDCNCADLNSSNAEEVLDDDGGPVSWRKAKIWERWVVNRCSLHGRR